jgi:triacylglycerol lipase
MASPLAEADDAIAPLRGELRYGLELARLVADREFLSPGRRSDAPPVLLVPGFMAGDQSLSLLSGWLRRRGCRTTGTGMRLNTDCAERAVTRIETRLRRLAVQEQRRVVVIGQSRGGELGRVLAVRNPDVVSALVMLGSPIRDPLSVGAAVLGAVRSVARLGDFGVPGMFSRDCGDGPCCASFRADLAASLSESIHAVSAYSRTDGIVAWKACLDPYADNIEVQSSHSGMSVNAEVYRLLGQTLDREELPWTG